jgi:hypothetical protein
MTIALVVAALAPPAAAASKYPTPSTVPGSSGAVTSRVATARNGIVAVAWASGRIAIRHTNGKWDSLHHVVASNRSVASVDIAFDSHDKLIATWVQSPSAPGHAIRGPFAVQAATWTTGSKWGTAHTLGHSGHFHTADPRVVTNLAGDALISWRGVRRNSAHQLRDCVSTSFRPSGGAFGHEQQVTDGGPYQDVGLDEHGNAYAVWTQATGDSTTNRFAYRKRGLGWGTPETFSANPSSAPALAVTPDGGVVIGYRAAQPDSEGNGTQAGAIFTIARSPSGSFGSPVELSATSAHEVRAAAARSGEVTLAWVDGGGLHFSTRPPGGVPSPEQTVTRQAQIGPLQYTSHGDALLAYGNGDGGIFLIERPHTGSAFGSPDQLAVSGQYPALSIGGSHAAVSWLDPSRNRLKVMVLTL